jgi:hypothetical protein
MRKSLCVPLLLVLVTSPLPQLRAGEKSVFAKDNLAAWCIVPYDAAKLGPHARAEMLQRLGIRHLAYDWRGQHVPTFEQEIVEMREHGIDFFAFWDFHAALVPLVKKYHIRPQFWVSGPSPAGKTQAEKVRAAARQLAGLVKQTGAMGCQFGLYNHGGWGGEPSNMVAIVKQLRQDGPAQHVGIVYNFHHAHGHIKDFAQCFAAMQPYLLCVNLNGMNDGERPKILNIGDGQHEQEMMETIQRAGYHGPIGIINHRENLAAEDALRMNLEGMKKVLQRMGDEAAKTY